MKRTIVTFFSLIAIAAFIVVACGPAATPTAAPTQPPPTLPPTEPPTEPPPTEIPPTEAPTEVPWTAPEGALVSVTASAAPTLDGVGDEAAWADAPAVAIEVSGGANFGGNGGTTVTLQSIYTGDSVYFLVTYADPTLSEQRAPWTLGEDGKWVKLNDPNDKGGDNNLYYEDKLAFIWPIDNSIANFDTQGCFTACHAGENPDVKPFGNKYTAGEGQMGDIWHWKSIRNLNQVDDQYLDWTQYSTDSVEAGRHSDPNDGGGYKNNETEDKTLPAWALPDNAPAPPYFIIDGEKVEFDASKYQAGDEVPAIVKSEIQGDRGDISAGWKYSDGQWTIEFGRKLVTASEKYDVQFNDLAATYYFGVAAFDNAQVRHAFETGSTPFVFKP